MRKKAKYIVGGLVALVILCGSIPLVNVTHKYNAGIVKAAVNGNKETIGKSIDEVSDIISASELHKLGDLDISGAVSLDVDTSPIESLSLIEYMTTDNVECTYKTNVDYNKLKEIIKDYNKSQKKSTSATYKRTEDGHFKVVAEKKGTVIDSKKLISHIKENGLDNIKLGDYIKEPKVTTSDMKKVVKKANKVLDWKATYTDGNTYTVPSENVTITTGGAVEVDYSFVDNIVRSLEKTFDNVGAARKFKTHSGKKVKVTGGTWGTIMDSAKEKDMIMSSVRKNDEIKDRTPYMKQEYTDIGDTYIEVSISDQHVWVYKKGKKIMDSACVTGNSNKGHDTPKGTYFISERINGKFLTGDNYKTWVNKWMRLTNQGVGLHDAYWRYSFGGQIYRSNGSHGCINLPKDFAYKLYDKTYVGMPVIVY